MFCDYCGKYISSGTYECPYCGAENPEIIELKKKIEEQKAKNKDLEKLLEQEEQNLIAEKKRVSERQKEIAEQNQEIVEMIRAATVYSIFTAIFTTAAFGASHKIDFLSMFLVFYIGDLIGNLIMFSFINFFFEVRNKKLKYILYTGLTLGCCILFTIIMC